MMEIALIIEKMNEIIECIGASLALNILSDVALILWFIIYCRTKENQNDRAEKDN